METGKILFKKTHQQLKIQSTWKEMFPSFIHQNIKIKSASFKRIDTEIVVFLPDNGDKLKEVFDG